MREVKVLGEFSREEGWVDQRRPQEETRGENRKQSDSKRSPRCSKCGLGYSDVVKCFDGRMVYDKVKCCFYGFCPSIHDQSHHLQCLICTALHRSVILHHTNPSPQKSHTMMPVSRIEEWKKKRKKGIDVG